MDTVSVPTVSFVEWNSDMSWAAPGANMVDAKFLWQTSVA